MQNRWWHIGNCKYSLNRLLSWFSSPFSQTSRTYSCHHQCVLQQAIKINARVAIYYRNMQKSLWRVYMECWQAQSWKGMMYSFLDFGNCNGCFKMMHLESQNGDPYGWEKNGISGNYVPIQQSKMAQFIADTLSSIYRHSSSDLNVSINVWMGAWSGYRYVTI